MQQQPGPPPDPGTEKRVLLAFVLTFAVIALMQPLISRYNKPVPPAASSTASQSASENPQSAPAAAASAAEFSSAPAAAPTKAKATSGKGGTPAAATKQASSETEL